METENILLISYKYDCKYPLESGGNYVWMISLLLLTLHRKAGLCVMLTHLLLNFKFLKLPSVIKFYHLGSLAPTSLCITPIIPLYSVAQNLS